MLKQMGVIWFVFIISLYAEVLSLQFRYHENEELEEIMRNMTTEDTKRLRTNLYSIGNSSKSGQPLWVLEITAAERGKIGIPNVKLIGNMHGNEAGGRELLLHYTKFLISNYGRNETVTWLLDNTRIHILPTLNPDGFAIAGNACDSPFARNVPFDKFQVDLNANFPDCFKVETTSEYQLGGTGKKYPNCKNAYGVMKNRIINEAEAVINWMENYTFILSASFHGGELVAIYPFESKHNFTKKTNESLTPDDDVFKHLARTYANNNPEIHPGNNCVGSFEGGITNGAKLNAFEGGMGDYNYAFKGCMELAISISCCKYTMEHKLESLWMQNKEALLHYCMQANMGLTGRVLDLHNGTAIEANLSIIGRKFKFKSSKKTGEFWRILLPGTYQLQVNAEGYYPRTIEFDVSSNDSGYPQLTSRIIHLTNTSIITTTTTPRTTMGLFELFIRDYMPPSTTIIPSKSRSSSSIMNSQKYILVGLLHIVFSEMHISIT